MIIIESVYVLTAKAVRIYGLAWLALLLACCPPVAEAKGLSTEKLSAEFSVKGSNGYTISVDGLRRQGVTYIQVMRESPRRNNFAFASYAVSGSTGKRGIKADFGSLGEISVRFKPSGKVRIQTLRRPKGCQGPRKAVRRLGVFVGTIRFIGESGYTSVDAGEAKGSIGTPTGVFCGTFVSGRHGKHRPRRTQKGAYLGATTSDNKLGFAAGCTRSCGRVSFVAGSAETAEPVSILRYVVSSGPAVSFAFDSALGSATVTPPAPFSGTATFQREPKGVLPSWTGSLAVSFPGAENVPLTGSNFLVLLTRNQ